MNCGRYIGRYICTKVNEATLRRSRKNWKKDIFYYVCTVCNMQYAIQNSEYMYPGTGRVANLNPDFHILDFRKCDVLLKRSSIIIWHLHNMYRVCTRVL
jgi:hypothetical protein